MGVVRGAGLLLAAMQMISAHGPSGASGKPWSCPAPRSWHRGQELGAAAGAARASVSRPPSAVTAAKKKQRSETVSYRVLQDEQMFFLCSSGIQISVSPACIPFQTSGEDCKRIISWWVPGGRATRHERAWPPRRKGR